MALLVKLFTISVLTVFVAVFLSYRGLELSFNDIKGLVKNTFFKTDKQVVTSDEVKDDIEIYNVISAPGDKLFTKEELSKYDGGENSPGVYLAVLGRVYDVESGKQHYGPGGGYSFFSAKDGTKAFITGQFNEKGLIDDATGFTDGQMLELEHWISFYDKTYSYKGKLIGNFYTSEGVPTPALHEAVRGIKVGHVKKKEQDEENKRFPPCNSQSKKGEYRRVSCSEKSGGIKRDWAGVPRQYFKTGAAKPKCVCVNTKDLDNPLLKPYDNCDLNAISCSLPPL